MAELRYAVRIATPGRHLAEVELRFPGGPDTVDVALPAWSPGSYLIRDYARFLRDLEVTSGEGAPLGAAKRDKATWTIEAAGAREIVVRYAVYGHDLSVRTNHLDAGHALLHGPATFLYPTHLRAAPVEVSLEAPDGWALTSALAWDPPAAPPWRLAAADIDELYDHPIHLGLARTYAVPARLPVKLAVWGERAPGGAFDEQRLAADLAAVVDDHVARFGEAPFPHYTFLLLLAHDAYGGLEHRASSVNLYHPYFAASRKAYEGLLELLSHELFHAWNGKRIGPRALLEPDYTREAYTRCLWAVEGLTSHYDRYALRTSGRITARSFLEKVLDDWARLQATPGRARQSLEAASFDAWIKLYRPDESNLNTTVSYYVKGGLAMLALDLHVRRRTDGARSLDDVLRALWRRHGARGVPHGEDLQPLFEEVTGLSLAEVFDRQIRGTEDPDLPGELAHVGLELRAAADPAQLAEGGAAVWLGATCAGARIATVFDGGPAQAAGLSPGDELVALDGFRAATEADLRSLVGARRVGDRAVLTVFRRHRLVEVPIAIGAAPPTRYELASRPDPGPAAARYQKWLGEAYPAAQVVASVTTTARWV